MRQIKRTHLLGAGILALMLIVNVIMTHNVFTEPYPGFNDFMTPWEASRSFFYDGLDPYSEQTSLNIQTRLYGRAALPDEQPNHFAYPFYAVLVTWPLIHLDYAWATAIWLVACEVMLCGALLLLLDLYKWRPRPLTLVGLLLFALFVYPAARGLILGQVSHLVYFLEVLALWALAKDHQRVAGVALAISTFKPQMGIFIVPFLLLWGIVTRRWTFVASFALLFAVLLGVSFALMPNWLEGFMYQLTLYPTYIEVSTPAWVITRYLFNLGQWAELALNVLGLLLMLWAWYGVLIQRRGERLTWTIMLTLTITHLIGLRTATPHFVVFMIPLVFYLRTLARRRQGVWIGLILAVLVVLPWVHFLTTIGDAKFEHPTTFLVLPLLTLTMLLLTREMWWREMPTLSAQQHIEPQNLSPREGRDSEVNQPA